MLGYITDTQKPGYIELKLIELAFQIFYCFLFVCFFFFFENELPSFPHSRNLKAQIVVLEFQLESCVFS